jgi:hypothetical protein
MNFAPIFIHRALLLAMMIVAAMTSCFAATLTQQIEPAEVNVGDQVTVSITIQNGTVADLHLPPVDGLQVEGSGSSTNFTFVNGTITRSMTLNFAVVPSRAGDFTIPAFDIHTQQGELLHIKAMKVHVLDNGTAPSPNGAPPLNTPPPISPADSATTPAVNPNGPVVMPAPGVAPNPTPQNNANSTDTTSLVPRDKDGGPAKVFIVILPQTTDAYVGQSVPFRIDFFIRMDVNAEQNSLPTIKGSDFLMNSFMTRGQFNQGMLENQLYARETWITAISAPKSGDFPLSMERDTYWVKSVTGNNFDPFGGFFSRHANLAHEMISSNQVIMHIHPLPDEGRPDHFTGAIGKFQVTGEAHPTSVNVGDPVALRFTVSGNGNFDYVRSPALEKDPAWKTYVPSSKTEYLDQSHTRANKTFEQSVIPQKNGSLPLPAATFSYFDPDTKQYVTVPVTLPAITVTGSPPPAASTSPADGSASMAAPATPPASDFLPNRLDAGSPRTSLAPVYRQPWFWAVQVGLLVALIIIGLFVLFRPRSSLNDDRMELARRQKTLQQEEDAMTDAVRRNDALAFFLAARHSIQIRLGAQWKVRPEALTLKEIRLRDPQLAETLEPLFAQADEVIYSGQASTGLDLTEWERRVRTELLQPQLA